MKFTPEQIDNIIEGKDKLKMPVFCIVKDIAKDKVTRERHTYWTIETSVMKSDSTSIDGNTAQKLISLFGLKPFCESKIGAVYDTPDQQYRRKFHGTPIPA